MEELKPNVPESKYAPLNLQEFNELKLHLNGIKSFLPEHLMSSFWSWCNRIRGEKTVQPCGCKSSARLWGDCVDTLKKFVKDKSE
jgi:hypothetical protein